MSKITFRADDELVERIESRDASKSEIMREALREYLDGIDRAASADTVAPGEESPDREAPRRGTAPESERRRRTGDSLDDVLARRVDELVAERLAAREARERDRATERAQDVHVNVTLETDATDASAERRVQSNPDRARPSDDASDDQARKPSPDAERTEAEKTCGQCGESLSDDHVYCPNCGEKAARRVFCECGDEVRSDWGFCPSCGRRTPAADVLDRS